MEKQICQDYTMGSIDCGWIFYSITWKLYFFVCLWQKELNTIYSIGPRTLRSQVSDYNIIL